MFPSKNSCLHFGLVSALCSLLAFLSVVAALPFGRSFHARDLANCACAELALEYGLRRHRGPQGHRCCGAGRGFHAVHRPPVLPGEVRSVPWRRVVLWFDRSGGTPEKRSRPHCSGTLHLSLVRPLQESYIGIVS
ncbi:hypothetical protein VPH35_113428 [Triticum aestivum]|uniref:Secreted protein n=1 Tax=Triticum turgidum subsp. durum TaxID=4567 RepID=A0A9R0YXH4_TRITD|nr:unnamed protein product [Triticum turgidum subsp. durum]